MAPQHPDRRTALITAGGIAAVVIAGAFAVWANIGILDASSDNQIGTLAAAGDLVATTVGRTAPAAPASSITTTAPAIPAGLTSYSVDRAGTVEIATTDAAMTVEAVTVNPGWTSVSGPAEASRVQVTFSDGQSSLIFTASRAADGTIDARVDEAAQTTGTAPVTPHVDADDHDDHDDHDGHDDHEGADDDD